MASLNHFPFPNRHLEHPPFAKSGHPTFHLRSDFPFEEGFPEPTFDETAWRKIITFFDQQLKQPLSIECAQALSGSFEKASAPRFFCYCYRAERSTPQNVHGVIHDGVRAHTVLPDGLWADMEARLIHATQRNPVWVAAMIRPNPSAPLTLSSNHCWPTHAVLHDTSDMRAGLMTIPEAFYYLRSNYLRIA